MVFEGNSISQIFGVFKPNWFFVGHNHFNILSTSRPLIIFIIIADALIHFMILAPEVLARVGRT